MSYAANEATHLKLMQLHLLKLWCYLALVVLVLAKAYVTKTKAYVASLAYIVVLTTKLAILALEKLKLTKIN